MLMPFTNNAIEMDPESVTKSQHITVGKCELNLWWTASDL